MKVRIIKKVERRHGKDLFIGRVVTVTSQLGKELIAGKKAIEYTDGVPVKKVKSDFFKPKIEQNDNRESIG